MGTAATATVRISGPYFTTTSQPDGDENRCQADRETTRKTHCRDLRTLRPRTVCRQRWVVEDLKRGSVACLIDLRRFISLRHKEEDRFLDLLLADQLL